MGGDGGVIASNRKYMRGAGTADHTGDSSRASKSETQALERENASEVMQTCALTKAPLPFDGSKNNIVACPYGRLYNKEAAVEALLRRKSSKKDCDNDEAASDELGVHIRGLKDLYPVRFAFQKTSNSRSINNNGLVPVCPITSMELNGQIPAYLILPGNPGSPANVVCQRAVREMGWEALESEYGPMEEKVRLAPSPAELVEIQKALEEKRDASNKRKDKKKRKKEKSSTIAVVAANSGTYNTTNAQPPTKVHKVSLADVARGRVQNSVHSNEVLSSIFTSTSSKMSQKEKNDNLFARS